MDVEQLIETWRGPLTGMIAGWGVPFRDAAELAQDTLVEAYLARERLRGDPHDPRVIGPWLRGVARNLHAAWARKRRTRREEPLAGQGGEPAPDADQDPRLEALRRALKGLPAQHREVLYMHYLEETSVRAVAGLLGVTEKTVEGRLHRARRMLRDAMSAAPGSLAEKGRAG
jgi:RNA polymerase sigma-70 factor (ECF subfamily)